MASDLTLLVIEDEPAILKFLRSSLEETDWRVLEATTGRLGIELAATKKPTVVLLDLGLPDMDGLDVLRQLRKWTSAPVIIVSARDRESDKIAGLDSGADDYLTKPFGIAELMARLRVARRHAEQKPDDTPVVYENGDLRIDLLGRRVWVKRKPVALSPLQYEVLSTLVRGAGRVVTHAQLMKEVWGEQREVTPESVRIVVHQLRHKIEPDPVRPKWLKTDPGIGYRLEAPE